MDINFQVSKTQNAFLSANDVDEVLFGGAAGGGKSYCTLIDAYRYALQYPKSKQLIMRRTFPELEKSLIRVSREMFSPALCKYNTSNHTYAFRNGSIIDFGYADSEGDVYKYQSAEYDIIRIDEATHFTEYMYTYMLSRIRGANDFPKMLKATSNPGNVGHTFIKSRFIDIGEPGKIHEIPLGGGRVTRRLFIPSKVQDNPFIMRSDPNYITRLLNLPEKEQKALLYGDWNVFEGQYFPEWNYELHTCEPFEIPAHWRQYTTMDYGYADMFAHYHIAVDEQNNVYVYREIYQSKLIVSDAVQAIRDMESEDKHGQHITRLAPPDLWNTQSITGKSTAILFYELGMPLNKANNDRLAGWYAIHELLKPIRGADGQMTARLKIFRNCVNLIRTLPMLQYDSKNPNDCAKDPHELTHAPDALRYFAISWTKPAELIPEEPKLIGNTFKALTKPKSNPLGYGAELKVI